MYFSKDLWSSDTTLSPLARSQVVGLARFGGICFNSTKYTIVEEIGGFYFLGVRFVFFF